MDEASARMLTSLYRPGWGRGAVGSAPRWHRGGRGFESHRLHHLKNSKNLPQKTANCYQLLLPALHFPLAFKHESFTLCEENGYGPLHSDRPHQRR